ncbi:hypothetical protein A343_0012, partial [Porphyromonas gingivalis JCVI SC001]
MIFSKPVKSKSAPGFFLSQLSSPLNFVPGDNTAITAPAVQELPTEILANVQADDKRQATALDSKKAEPEISADEIEPPL